MLKNNILFQMLQNFKSQSKFGVTEKKEEILHFSSKNKLNTIKLEFYK